MGRRGSADAWDLMRPFDEEHHSLEHHGLEHHGLEYKVMMHKPGWQGRVTGKKNAQGRTPCAKISD